MKKRRFIGLRLKFAILFLLFSIIIMFSVGKMTYNNYRKSTFELYYDKALSVAKLVESNLDSDDIIRYSQTLQEDENYIQTVKTLNNIRRQTDVMYIYVIMPKTEDSTIYIFDAAAHYEFEDASDIYEGVLGEIGPWDENFISAKKSMETGKPSESLDLTDTAYGYLASVYVPILDDNGKAIAIVGVDIEMDKILNFLKESLKNLLTLMFVIIFICFIMLLILVNYSIISPIKILGQKVNKIANGELGVTVPIRSNDEIGQIAEVFNRMSFNISMHINEVTSLNDAYYKFVPSIILDLFNKNNIKELELGDNCTASLGILRMKINGFDEITKKMNSKDMFKFINDIYKISNPIIFENNGVIDTYLNDGLNAIYGQIEDNALKSAITILQKVNQQKNNNIDLSFAISKGNPMVGIVGNEDRLSPFIMSEQMMIVTHLMNVSDKYKAKIIITGSAIENITDFNSRYNFRFLGILKVNLSNNIERLYDVYDGDDQQTKALKDYTKKDFENGVKLYLKKNFYEARKCFINVLKVSQNDYSAREYLYLCNKYYKLSDTSNIDIYLECV